MRTSRQKIKKTVSGIGLSIVKNILEDNRGTITLLSELGKGQNSLSFWNLRLCWTIIRWRMGKTILIAEDEEILRELLAELLQSYNYTVLTSANGDEVLEILKN